MANKSANVSSDLGVEIVIPLYSTIFVLAVIGNTLVIITLLKNRRMRTVTNIFLLNLAFADLLLGVFCMPFTLVGQILQNFIFGQLMCNLIPFFQASSVSSSVWTLVAISLERYFAICRPLRSRSWQTICLPTGLLTRLQPLSGTGRNKCREVWPSPLVEKSYNLLLLILLLVIPLILMGFAYALITHQLRLAMQLNSNEPSKDSEVKIRVTCGESGSLEEKRDLEHRYCAKNLAPVVDAASNTNTSVTENSRCFPGHMRSCPSYCCPKNQNAVHHSRPSVSDTHHSNRSQNQNFRNSVRSTYSERSITAKKKVSQVIVMLCAIVIEFFVCWTPLSIINAWVVFDPEGLYRTLGPTWISLIQLLAYLSSCCNPVTYGFLNLQFRTAFLNVFGCKGGLKNGRGSVPLRPPVFVMSPIEKRRRTRRWMCLQKLYSCGRSSDSDSSEV